LDLRLGQPASKLNACEPTPVWWLAQLVLVAMVIPFFALQFFAYENGDIVPNGERDRSFRAVVLAMFVALGAMFVALTPCSNWVIAVSLRSGV
jgi:hypothetical protein